LHNSIGTVDLYPSRARSKATTSARLRSPSSYSFRTLPENQLSQKDYLHSSQGVVDEYKLVGPALDILPIDEGKKKQQKIEQRKNNDNNKNKNKNKEP